MGQTISYYYYPAEKTTTENTETFEKVEYPESINEEIKSDPLICEPDKHYQILCEVKSHPIFLKMKEINK